MEEPKIHGKNFVKMKAIKIIATVGIVIIFTFAAILTILLPASALYIGTTAILIFIIWSIVCGILGLYYKLKMYINSAKVINK